ncbi:hypothetical protein D3C85_998050 [compost metagenome]
MNTKKARKLKGMKVGLTIAASALLVAVGLIIGFKFFFNEDAYSIVKNKVLVNSRWLDGAEIVSQKLNLSKDEQIDLHVKVSRDTARDMISQNIIKECVSISERCTQPRWISFAMMQERYPLATPYISEGTNAVVCTSYWAVQYQDGRTNNQDGICIDPETGDFWYTYYDV